LNLLYIQEMNLLVIAKYTLLFVPLKENAKKNAKDTIKITYNCYGNVLIQKKKKKIAMVI
jgi:hypothetical protein